MAFVGNALGAGPHFRTEADRHPLNVFVVLVRETAGGRKGTSHGHIRRAFETVDPQWGSTRILTGLSSGEGLIFAVRDPQQINGQSDPGIADKRLLVIETEFAGALRIMSRDGNTLSHQIRQAWDGGKLAVLNKNSPWSRPTPCPYH
jgi:hypothetical protein